jgi:hypothetical protein
MALTDPPTERDLLGLCQWAGLGFIAENDPGDPVEIAPPGFSGYRRTRIDPGGSPPKARFTNDSTQVWPEANQVLLFPDEVGGEPAYIRVEIVDRRKDPFRLMPGDTLSVDIFLE